jgi:hypothetical protein
VGLRPEARVRYGQPTQIAVADEGQAKLHVERSKAGANNCLDDKRATKRRMRPGQEAPQEGTDWLRYDEADEPPQTC